jgi:transposase-like protein
MVMLCPQNNAPITVIVRRTLEGLWAALRTFLRPFGGVHKRYLAQYVVMFEWEYNLKDDFKTLLRAMLLIDSP